MKKLVLVAAVAAAIVVGGALPANAAPVRSVPSAPIALTVHGSDDTATVQWRARPGSAPFTSWIVSARAAGQRTDQFSDRVPAKARSHCFEGLTPSTTYTFSVRATNQRGVGKASSVQYTTPAAPVPVSEGLYALDGSGNVVRFPTDGGTTATTVAPNGAGYTADPAGDVFVPSADRTSIVEYPHGGGAAHTVATGQHVTADLKSDAAGNVYWADSATNVVTKLAATGGTPSAVPGIGIAGTAWSVAPNGTIASFRHGSSADTIVVRSASGAVSTRSVNSGPFPSGSTDAVLVESDGDVYAHVAIVGAAGYDAWYVFPVGSTTATRIADRTAFEIGAVSQDGFVLLESKEWCSYPSELPISPNGCTIDRSFSDELVRSGTTTTTHPVTGIAAGTRNITIGAVDSDGDLFADIPAGTTPGLWRVPAGGGAAQQLSAAQFSRLIAA